MLSDIGSWASILSLPITIWVLIQTFLIKRQFAARARIPEIRKSLASISRSFLGNIKNSADLDSAHEDLAKALAVLKNLKSKVGAKKLSTLSNSIDSISHASTSQTRDPTQLWGAYTLIVEISTSLEQIERDMNWN